jgi:hypothetical protein
LKLLLTELKMGKIEKKIEPEEIISEQPQSDVKNKPVIDTAKNNAKGGDFRSRLNDCTQALWCGTLCLCCVNSCFTLVENISGCL